MEKTPRHALRNIISRESIYKGAILDLNIDHVLFPSGSEKIREVVKHKSAVTILPVYSDGKIVLVRQYRHAVDEDLYEIPAGLIEPGEDPTETAIRELQEEIGYKPGKIKKVFEFYTSPGYSTERIIFYYATDLHTSKLAEDDDEYIKVYYFTLAEIKSMIDSGEIVDGKTIMAYCWLVAKKAEENVSR
ncbi:MAG: NUDIX hydrolase [Synergistaceae bacterium]|nr:NUDIX hydrolase [Synergistaceae bacterium]